MMQLLKTVFYIPLYNALVIITGLLPGADLGLAIILLTIAVKVIIFPLYTKSVRAQMKMKEVEPEINKIKEKQKNNPTEQSKQIFEVYRQYKINPFSGFLVLLIQIPIILALFYVFKDSFNVNPDLLYYFVDIPEKVSHEFLGLIDITSTRNYILAALTGFTQFAQVNITMPKKATSQTDASPSFKADFAKSMDLQIRYIMPILIIFISLGLPAAISIYWITSNIIHLIYGLWVKKHLKTATA